MSLGATFAADTNQTDSVQSANDDAAVSVEDTDAVSSTENTNDSDENILLETVDENGLSKVIDEKLAVTSVDVTDYASLSSAITQSNQIINIKSNITFESRLTITGHNLIIEGNGYTINGQNKSTAFFLQELDNVTLKNINFKDGHSTIAQHSYCTPGATGGCVAIINCTNFNLIDCNFTHMQATAGTNKLGSAILVGIGENILIEGCRFTDCTTTQSGGAIEFIRYLPSGASGSDPNAYTYTKNAVMKDLTFIECHCSLTGGNGGAIELYVRDSSLINCTFIHCRAGGTGGALDLHGGCANTLVENCTFINNTAINGGAFSATDTNSIDTIIRGCTFKGNNASTNGGAIRYAATGTNVSNCIFENNYAKSYGGAVYAGAQNSTVDNCKFENNTASDGSNFYAVAGSPITITNCGFDLFYVSDDGTGDGLRIGAPTNFVDAVQSIENGGRVILIGTFTNLKGGEVGKPVTIEGYNNAAVINLLGANSRAFTVRGDNITVKGITFKNSLISNADGGAIYWIGANGKIDNCTFDNNSARNGGAIYWAGANGNITGSTFTKNTATANGGAVYFTGNNSAIESSTFTNNQAVYGSAVFIKDGVSNFEIKETSFTSNVASTAGTVAAEKLTTFSLGGNTFTSNTASTAGTNEYYFYENTPVITSSLVYVSPSGSATSNGLTESSPTTLDHAIDSIIENGGEIVFLSGNYNFARTINNMNITFVGRTGAVITGSRTSRVFTITGSSNIVFNGFTFKNLAFGTSSVDGAISVASSNVTIKNSEFNTVTGSKLTSVITYDASSTGSIESTTFTSNTATNIVNINGNVNIKDSSFTSNKATTSSVSYNGGSKGTVSGTTFSSNSGTTRNLYVNSNNVVVSGNTFDVTAAYNSLSTIVYPNNVALSASFNAGSNYAFNGITSKNGNTVVATGSVSNNVYSATWTKPLPGTYTLTLTNTDNKGNTFNYASTPTVSVPVRLSTVYVGPSATGAGTGIDSSNLILWDNVAAIATDTAKIIFTAGTYTNFYGKTINKGWTLSGSGNVVLDAGNNGRIFSISGSNTVKIEGMTLQNGKVTSGTGGAIYNNGATLTIDNCKFYGNTAPSANIIGSTNTVTVTNSVLQNAFTISNTDINYGVSKTITGSFINTHPASVTLKLNNNIQQTATVSDSLQFSATFSNLAVGSYVVSCMKNLINWRLL